MKNEQKEFQEYFRNIIRQKTNLRAKFVLYRSTPDRESAQKIFTDCSEIRGSIVDDISSISMYYGCYINRRVGSMMMGSDELDDLCQAAMHDYMNYSLEDFLNAITEEVYDIHNAMVMDGWLRRVTPVAAQ